MLIQQDITESLDAFEQEMREAVRIAKNSALPEPISFSFVTSELSDALIEELSSKLPTGYKNEDKGAEFIYLFSLADSNTLELSEILLAFESAREWQFTEDYEGKKNLCRPNPWHESTRVLYVGRSYKPRGRLKQHLSHSITGTYAIHFATWASKLDAQVDFHIYRYSDLGDRAVQVIEDGLWDRLLPLLGKRGQK